MVLFPLHQRRNQGFAIAVIVLAASFVANAAEPVTVTTSEEPGAKAPLFFHGSSLSYGHSISAMTFDPAGELHYNPTWQHTLTLRPEFHFINDLFFARGLMFISQEFTQSDTTSSLHEVEFSDAWIDLGYSGWTEPNTGITVKGDVRFTLPASKLSQLKTQVMNIGPGVSLARKFPVLSGLTVSYGVRSTGHINLYQGPRTWDSTLPNCDLRDESCASNRYTGGRNAFFDLSHGPAVSFAPIETVSIDSVFLMTRAWLYPVAPTPTALQGSNQLGPQEVGAPAVKDLTRFMLSVSWQFTKPVGVSLTALTISPQLGDDGRYIFPLFNRYTTLYLDFSLDVEATVSRFL
jgi:hypothetical protein